MTCVFSSIVRVRFLVGSRWAALGLLVCLATSTGHPSSPGGELMTVDGERMHLAQALHPEKTLVLIIREEPELPEAFRVLTLAESRGLHAILLVSLPESQPLRSATIRKAARKFLNSDLSRSRIYFANTSAVSSTGFRRAAVLSASLDLLWRSADYPSDAEFDTAAFRR